MAHRRKGWRAALLLGVIGALLASSCASDSKKTSASSGSGDGSGKTVTMFGPEVEGEAQGLKDTFKQFEADTGITIKYQGDRSFEEQIGVRVDGGNAPDIAMFPQPGKIADFASDLKALDGEALSNTKSNFDAGWTDLVTISGKVMAVPVKADLKSLVWYSPEAFKAAGYTVPESQEDLMALADKMVADGKTPFCIGLGSDAATGWPMTDWIEDYMLRLKGPAVYDKWYKHQIPFDDPDVVEVVQYVHDLWAKKGYVYGGMQNVAATPFADAGLPLLKGDCMMHRQGNFYAANWPKGTKLGDDGQVSAFYMPTFKDKDFGRVTLSGGIYAAAFSDRPEVKKALAFIASTDFADTRAPVGGFLSPNKNTDVTKYPTPIEQKFADILAKADPARFDASDLMPGAVGAGSFWTACVDIVTGAKDVKTALAAVEKSWPKS
ncbi:MAG: extracellular solute-binding protein family 1 [Actinomycetia bacterium]|nr:extracellular solute-binding protein family 1 [Actinomycetes bacterium]